VGNTVDFGESNLQQHRKWGISIHGSHYGLIEKNVVDYASGAGIVLESGEEAGNLFNANFVVRVIGGNGARDEDLDPGDGSKSGRAGTAFWFNGGGRNSFHNNIAAAVVECEYCYGFKFDNVHGGGVESPSAFTFPLEQGADPHMSDGEIVEANAIGINSFVGNETYAVPNGLTVWWECTYGDVPTDGCSSSIESFHVWHHHRWGYFGYPVSNMVVNDFVARGDPDVLTNPYEHVAGLDFSDYIHRNLVITNADIQNMHTGIHMPTMRDARYTDGADIGFTTVEDSYIGAIHGVSVWAPNTANGIAGLPPQTTVLRNVEFGYPDINLDGRDVAHIKIQDYSRYYFELDLTLRNDVHIYNYNKGPGIDGDNLYMFPGYQESTRCDDSLGECATNRGGSYPDLGGGYVHPLR
jgi:hypothetical protein